MTSIFNELQAIMDCFLKLLSPYAMPQVQIPLSSWFQCVGVYFCLTINPLTTQAFCYLQLNGIVHINYLHVTNPTLFNSESL